MTREERQDLAAYLRELRWEHSAAWAAGKCPRLACDCDVSREIEWAEACLKAGRLLASNEL